MNAPSETPNERGPGIAAFAVVFALASLLVELACTLGMQTFDLEELHVEPWGVRSGALLRLPLSLALGALLGATSGTERKPTRFLVPALLAAPWIFLDVLAYRTLATSGDLPRYSLLIGPRELFRGPFVTSAIACAAIVTLAGLFVAPVLVGFFERRFAREGIALADTISIALATSLSLGAIFGGSASVYDGAVPPAVHFFRAEARHDESGPAHSHEEPPDPEPTDGVRYPPRDVRELLYSLTGVEAPLPLADPTRPFCRAIVPVQTPRRRSVILLVLHDVGTRELEASFPGGRAMPNLARIADEGVSFTRFFATSQDPTQGLVSLLGGVQVVTPAPWVTLPVPPALPTLAGDLAGLGFGTYFVHATDPGLARARTLARTIGFATIDAPSPTTGEAPSAFARTDTDSVARVEAVIARHRSADATKPFFVAATLLGTAEPYALPTGSPRVSRGDDDWSRFGDALHATDAALGAFYSWYRTNEAPKGTLLVVTSDAASSLARPEDPRGDAPPRIARFEAPLVIAGLPDAELAEARTAKTRLGNQADVAQTILGLEGLAPFGCYEGRDLLSQAGEFPTRRVLLSTLGSGDGLWTIAHDETLRWELLPSQPNATFRVFDRAHDADLARDVVAANEASVPQMTELVLSFIAVGGYLSVHDRFVPASTSAATASHEPARAERVAALGGDGTRLGVGDAAKARSEGFGGVRFRIGFEGSTPALLDAPARSIRDALAQAGDLRVVLAVGSAPAATLERLAATRALIELVAPIARDRLVLSTTDVELALSLSSALPHPVFLAASPAVPPDALVRAVARHGLAGVTVRGAEAPDAVQAAHASGLLVLLEAAEDAEIAGTPDLRLTP